MKAKSKKVFIIPLLCAVLLAACLNRNSNFTDSLPLDTVLTKEQAASDLDFMYRTVKDNHICYIDGSGLDKTFDSAYESAKERLSGLSTVTVRDLWEIGAQMYCSLEDGHTIITYNGGEIYYNPEAEGRLISVNGVSAEELLNRFSEVFPCEPQVDFYRKNMLGYAVCRESWLRLLGIDVSGGVAMTFETAEGEKTFDFPPYSGESSTAQKDSEDFYGYTIDEENSAGIFRLDECTVTKGYKQALSDFFREVKEKDIKRVAVDLRNNGGGNSDVIIEFMKYIDVDSYYLFGGVDVRQGGMLIVNKAEPEKNQKSEYAFSPDSGENNDGEYAYNGRLYALTSNYTFSSAMDFAVAISDNGLGKIVGEVPGNMPTCYGDKLSFQTPNAKLLCSVSYKKFYRIDRSKDNSPLIPDIEVSADEAQEAFINDRFAYFSF
ncbi:MAG: S41 family peptidase [Ruminiclostridium sp.]